jgi:hypothetical protein
MLGGMVAMVIRIIRQQAVAVVVLGVWVLLVKLLTKE